MRYRLFIAAAGVLTLGGIGCAPAFDVHTMAAPRTTLSEFHTFHLLPVPRRRDGLPGAGVYDPMVSNSITNRALRETVTTAFQNRGYLDVEWMPDFVVAVYASTREKLDITQWEYGYPYWPRWWWRGTPRQFITQYTEGTVIVDVIDPESLDLLWRGTATASLVDDPAENTKQLQKAAAAVIDKFPKAKPHAVAAARLSGPIGDREHGAGRRQ
jgi:hypothetical protein